MVDIILSAYNGERFLPALLESLAAQTARDIRILARSDGSTDSTLSLLRSFAEREPRLTVFDGAPSGSAAGGFFAALPLSDGPYTMLCDQDDVWHPDKVQRSLAAIREAEAQYGTDTPLLLHTDLRVIDGEGRELAPSLMKLQALHPERSELPRLLCQSLCTGCTLLLNAPLRELVLSALPETCLMHDWWISLVAAGLGHVVYLPETTIDYRQHGDNTVGAKNVRSPAYILSRLRDAGSLRTALWDTCEQAAAFDACFGGLLSPADRELVRAYALLPKRSKKDRAAALRRLGTEKTGLLRKTAQYLFI